MAQNLIFDRASNFYLVEAASFGRGRRKRSGIGGEYSFGKVELISRPQFKNLNEADRLLRAIRDFAQIIWI